MKIILIQSFIAGDKFPPVFPLGLSYLASFLNDHDVKIYDPNTRKEPFQSCAEEIEKFSPDIIGISFRNIDNQSRLEPLDYYSDFRNFLQFIRKTAQETPIIVGGPSFSMFPKEIMENNPEIDYGVILEGEVSFSELLSNLDLPEKVKGICYRKNNNIIFTDKRPLQDFRSFPQPRRDLFELHHYSHERSIGIQGKRGCPLHCTYCNYPMLNGNKIRMRRPKDIVDEIETMVQQYGVTQLTFADGVFNLPVKHATEVCEEIIKRELKIGWVANMAIKGFSLEFLRLVKKAGCDTLMFSPDGLSSKSLKKMKKGIREKDVWKTLWVFMTNSEFKNMTVFFNFFLDSPGQTRSGVMKIFLFKLISVLLKFFKKSIIVSMEWIRIEPFTSIHNTALEENVIPEDKGLLHKNRKEILSFFYSNSSLESLDSLIFKTRSLFKKLKKTK